MSIQLSIGKWISLYYEIDELLKAYDKWLSSHELGKFRRQPTRKPVLTTSEIATIMVGYHLSGYKNFEYYYCQLYMEHWGVLFPNLPTYKTFLSYIPKILPVMLLWAKIKSFQGTLTGHYFIDSKKIAVCHLLRQHQHQVFKDYAAKGKTSVGWFYGFKLHLVINHLGEIVQFVFTSGNVGDNNHGVLKTLLQGLDGYCVGDKGYYTKLFEEFHHQGLHLLVKRKKNTTQKSPLPEHQSDLMKKRGLIESTFDILTTICDLEHSRHRSPMNAYAHMLGALIAYQHLDAKPNIFIKGAQNHSSMAA